MDFGRYYEEGTNTHHLERRGPSLSAVKSARFSLPGKILWQKPNINIKENIKEGCSWLVAFRRRTPAYSWVTVDRGLVQVRRMPGNGDCLFEAIHHQLGIVRPEVPAPTVEILRRSVQIFLKRERKKDETVYLNILNTASADPYIRSAAMETLRERRKLASSHRRSASRASRDSASRTTRDSAPSSLTLNDGPASPYSKRTASGSALEHSIKRTASVGSASVPASRRAASTSPALARSSSSDVSVEAKKRTHSGSALEHGIKRSASVGSASRPAASTSPALDRSSSSDASVEAKSERLESFRRDEEESSRREEVESSDEEPFEEQEINDMLIEKFIDQVGMRSVWGGTESIYALSQMLQNSIHLYNENGPDFLFDGFPNEIRICYRGSPGGRNHYDSVVAAHFKATRLPVMLYISPCVYLEYKILYYNFVTKRQRFFRLFRKQCDRCAKQCERCAKQYDRCAKQCAGCAKRCQDFVKECATEEELLKESASTTNRERS
ncbi:uncharacterized protein [Bemisia tabaci]|uniref:uncharacterized protein n=1 Tax=Bemisia tabaci TaxID=7038 RepID=UPI003B27D426